MTLLDITFANVFVVPYNINGENWKVRVMVEPKEDKEILSVVNATDENGVVIPGGAWDKKLEDANLLGDFWASSIDWILLQKTDLDQVLAPIADA